MHVCDKFKEAALANPSTRRAIGTELSPSLGRPAHAPAIPAFESAPRAAPAAAARAASWPSQLATSPQGCRSTPFRSAS